MEARAQELDPGKTRTIGSYVIGTSHHTQAKLWEKEPSVKLNQPSTSPQEKKSPSKS